MSVYKTYTLMINRGWKGEIVFKYHLNGFLAAFDISDNEPLSEQQSKWLFGPNFPYKENQIKQFKGILNFTLVESELDLGFETFWSMYGLKVKKIRSQKLWDKLSNTDRRCAISGIRIYNNYLTRKTGIQKANPDTYLNQRYWEDDYGSVA